MEQILTWVKGILGCLLIMSLILQIVPGKVYRPYLRFFMGIVLILTVLSPLVDLSGIGETLETLIGELAYHEEIPGWEEKLIKGEEWAAEQIIQKARELSESDSGREAAEGESAVLAEEKEDSQEEQQESETDEKEIKVIVDVGEVREIPPVVISGGE